MPIHCTLVGSKHALRGTPISCFSWCNFEARRAPGSESVTWFSLVETVSRCRRDEKWSFMRLGSEGNSIEGLYQVLYLSCESRVCGTCCCLPACVWVIRAFIALLCFDFTSLVGIHTEDHLSLYSEIWLVVRAFMARVWHMQKPWITHSSYGV